MLIVDIVVIIDTQDASSVNASSKVTEDASSVTFIFFGL